MNFSWRFHFRSFTGLRTRWERTTGGASQISSPCRWRNGWQPFTGCNCFHNSVPHHWGQFPLWYYLLLWKMNLRKMLISLLCWILMRSLFLCTGHSLWETIWGTSFTQGTCYPLLGGKGLSSEGREGVRTPPRPDGRGGREVVAAVLTAPMHRQGGKEAGRTTLSWEENSSNHIEIRNNETFFSLCLFPKHLVFCYLNYWKET